jgi:hypothetical protein
MALLSGSEKMIALSFYFSIESQLASCSWFFRRLFILANISCKRVIKEV